LNNPWGSITPPADDVNVRLIDHTHALRLFWARDHTGRYLFVYEFLEETGAGEISLPDLIGIRAQISPPHGASDKTRLVLVLNETDNWEIFYALCTDIVNATVSVEGAAAAVQVILRRLSRWQEFLKNNRPRLLSEERIKGLIGELLFLDRHLVPAFDVEAAVSFWQGPEGLPQDFCVNDGAVEVKCQSGATEPTVKITSADQLCPQLPHMHLYVVTLGQSTADEEGAVNLPTLVGRLKELAHAASADCLERFYDLMLKSGYVECDEYLRYSYVVAGQTMFEVSEGFPRICRDAIHPGISRVSYSISLTECSQFEGAPDWVKL